MKKRKEDFSIKELISIFVPKLWFILLVAFIFGNIMAIYSAVIKDDTYTSTTRIHVTKKMSGFDFAVSDVEFATSYLKTYEEVLKIPDFLIKVREDFKANRSKYEKENEVNYEERGWDNLSPNTIKGYITSETKQDILSVSVTTGDPVLSAALAHSIANVFSQTGYLAYTEDVVNVAVLQDAQIPTAPNSRKVVLNTIIGVAVGGILSMAFVFIMHMMDVIIHDKKKLEDNFDIPVLGVIPRFVSEEGKSKK